MSEMSRESYVLAKVLVSLDELKDAGYVAGGVEIDRERCLTAVEAFEAAGNDPMTDDEMGEAVRYLMMDIETA